MLEKGYCGVIHESNRMDLIKNTGKNSVLFDPLDAGPVEGTIRIFTEENDKIIEVKENV